jgi:outer membrane usher protein
MQYRVAALAALLYASCPHAFAEPPPFHLAGPMLATRLNKTGKPQSFPATVKEEGVPLGEVDILIAPDDTISVDRAKLLALLATRVTPDVHARIAALAEPAAYIPIAALSGLQGFAVAFNPTAMELDVKAAANTTLASDIDFGRRQAPPTSKPPATTSAYVNITTMLDQSWGAVGMPAATGLNFDYQGAARMYGMVLESEGGLDGPLDSFLCPAGAQCSYAHQNGFKRRSTRLVKDFPDDNTRLLFGDVTYSGPSLQRGGDFLGFAVKHDTRAIGHARASSAVSTLELDSPADVDVIINGQQTQRLRLRTGTYNLRNLPLGAGTNDIELVVTSTSGERRSVRVAAVSNENLLPEGEAEWVLAGGYASYQSDGQRAYLADQPGASSYVRYGIANGLTGEIHAQADTFVGMTGASLVAGGPLGLWTIGLAASSTILDPVGALDYAATLSWQYLPPAKGGDHRHSIRASAEYRGLDFHTPGETLLGFGGILYPTYAPALRLDAAWGVAFPSGISTSLSGRYLLPSAATSIPGAIALDVPMWGVDLTFSTPINETLSGSAWVGYGNNGLLNVFESDFTPEFLVGLRFNWRPSANSEVQIGADTSLANADLYASRRAKSSTGDWSGTVNITQTPGYGALLNTSLSNRNAYGATSLNHSAQAQSFGFDDLASPTNMRTSLRTTSALAFADGHFAMGAPIHDAFAIVAPHESLPTSKVIVGNLDNPTATGSAAWPALVTNLSAGSNVSLPIDATDIPPGYSLGQANLSLSPEYKAGYAIEVGSADALTAFGTLLLPSGKPLTLTAATADKDGKRVRLFTNSRGRFAVEGLSPGSWRITAVTPKGQLEYLFTVAPGATALTNAGALFPANRKREHDPAPFMDASAAGAWMPVVSSGVHRSWAHATDIHAVDHGGWSVHTR